MLTDKVSCYLMKVRSCLRVSMIYDEGTYSPINDLALSISYVYVHAYTCMYEQDFEERLPRIKLTCYHFIGIFPCI